MSNIPDEDTLKSKIENLIKQELTSDEINNLSIKAFLKRLVKSLGITKGTDEYTEIIKHKKAFIKECVTETLDSMEDQVDEDDEDDESSKNDESSSVEEDTKQNKKKKQNPFNAPKELSPELSRFLLKLEVVDSENITDRENHIVSLSRPKVTKHMWDYIKEHNLQNPENKREILLDKKMKKVFQTDQFTMFQMAKYISAHIHPFKPVDLTTSSTPSKNKKTTETNNRKKRKRKESTSKTRKKPNFPKHKLSSTLSDFLGGVTVSTRQNVTSLLHTYIKENDLQNPENRREILCDSKLRKVMGNQKKITYFSMMKFITPHILEKVEDKAVDDAENVKVKREEHVKSDDSDNVEHEVKRERKKIKISIKKEKKLNSSAVIKQEM